MREAIEAIEIGGSPGLPRRSLLAGGLGGVAAVMLGACTGGSEETPRRVWLEWSQLSGASADDLEWRDVDGDPFAVEPSTFATGAIVAAPASAFRHKEPLAGPDETSYTLMVQRDGHPVQLARLASPRILGEFADWDGQRQLGIALPLGRLGMRCSFAQEVPDPGGAPTTRFAKVAGVNLRIIDLSPWPERVAAVPLANYPPDPLVASTRPV